MSGKIDRTEFFYLRVQRDNGIHRVGAIAIRYNAGRNDYTVSGSLCSDNDQFEAKLCRSITMDRFNGNYHCVVNPESVVYGGNRALHNTLVELDLMPNSENLKLLLENKKNNTVFDRMMDDICDGGTAFINHNS